MSDFAKLRAARQAKEKQKSFVPRTRIEKGADQDASQPKPVSNKDAAMPEAPETTAPLQVPERLYGVWSGSEFEIRIWLKDSLRGRGVFSRRQYRPGDDDFFVSFSRQGDRVVTLKPDISVLSIANLSRYCSACTSAAQPDGNNLKRCAGCTTVHYCSTDCQTRDWSIHKLECAALQSWAKSAPSTEVAIPSDAVRCLGRVLWKKKKSGGENYFRKEFDTMQSHRTNLQPSVYELHTHLAHALVRYLNLNSPQEMQEYGLASIADLVDLISRFTTNTVALTTSSLTPIGACISPSIALLNHSCDPNIVFVFPRTSANPNLHEPLLQVIAIKPIKPGEELLTAYIDTTLGHEERRKMLKETYSFDCQCTLCCPAPGFIDPRGVLLCPTRRDSSACACSGVCGIPAEGTNVSYCNVCNSSIDSETIEEIHNVLRVSQEGLVKARELEYKDPERAIRLISNLTSILTSAELAPGTHPLLALSRLHSSTLVENLPELDAVIGPAQESSLALSGQSTLQASGAEDAQEKLDNAIRASLHTSTGLTAVLVPGHPVRGLALAELGKLLSVDEPVPKYLAGNDNKEGPDQKDVYPPSGPARLWLARETLIRARTELMVGFGSANEGGEIGMEVRDWLVRVEKELQVWRIGMQGGARRP